MNENYGNADPELLGIAPLVAPIIIGVTTLGSTIAGLVAAKRQQRRAGEASGTQQAHDLKMAEIAAKEAALKRKNATETAALAIGLPAIAAMFLL